MFVRQVKRKCSVRGCKNTDCYAISRSREVGNTVIICKSCLGSALGAIDEIDPKTKSNIPVTDNADIPPLFFNSQSAAAPEATPAPPADGENDKTPANNAECGSNPPADDDEQNGNTPASGNSGENDVENNNDADLENGNIPPADDENDAESSASEADGFICPHCGDKFGSEKGLKTHLRYCKQQNKE